MNMDMGAGGAEYADHEVQVIFGKVVQENVDGGENDTVIQFEPVSDRGLDSDELAELVGWRRNITAKIVQEDEASQTFVGDGQIEVGLGINLTEGEFAEQSGRNFGAREIQATADQTIVANNYSEPGVLDTHASSPTTGFISGTEGAGGSGTNVTDTESQFYPDYLGSGPYVDRTDDITLHLEAQSVSVVGRIILEAHYILYWNVEEMPEGRASFARP